MPGRESCQLNEGIYGPANSIPDKYRFLYSGVKMHVGSALSLSLFLPFHGSTIPELISEYFTFCWSRRFSKWGATLIDNINMYANNVRMCELWRGRERNSVSVGCLKSTSQCRIWFHRPVSSATTPMLQYPAKLGSSMVSMKNWRDLRTCILPSGW